MCCACVLRESVVRVLWVSCAVVSFSPVAPKHHHHHHNHMIVHPTADQPSKPPPRTRARAARTLLAQYGPVPKRASIATLQACTAICWRSRRGQPTEVNTSRATRTAMKTWNSASATTAAVTGTTEAVALAAAGTAADVAAPAAAAVAALPPTRPPPLEEAAAALLAAGPGAMASNTAVSKLKGRANRKICRKARASVRWRR